MPEVLKADMFDNIDKYRMEGFNVIGNLYYVGTKVASTHIIDTGDGLVMIDSGYDQLSPLVLENMNKLGLDTKTIKYIIHTHGHIDHMGATKRFKELSDAETVIGLKDRDYANGRKNLSYAKELGLEFDTAFEPDILINDGDRINCGRTEFVCRHTPGHTEGTMSYFFNIDCEDGRKLVAGTHGGIGINTMSKAFLEKYGLPLSLRESFLNGLDEMRKEIVDVFIPNHQDQWDTMERFEKLKNGDKEVFVDRNAWPAYLDMAKQRLASMLKEENEI